MVWGNKTSTHSRSSRWTQDPRYDFRSNRDENSSVTSHEIESRKNIPAMVSKGDLLKLHWRSEEDAATRSLRATSVQGTIVRTVCPLWAPQPVQSNQEYSHLFLSGSNRSGFGAATLEEGSVGVLMGKTRTRVPTYIRGRTTYMDAVAYAYLFGDQVYFFVLQATEFLDAADSEE